jgi:hypothetical protein
MDARIHVLDCGFGVRLDPHELLLKMRHARR